MMKTQTPETDSLIFEICNPSITKSEAYRKILKLGRKLERERDEARDSAEKAKAFKRVLKEDNAKLRRERDEARDDARFLLKEIFNLTQIGDPHPVGLPMRALQAIAEMIDEHLNEARNGSER